MTEKTPLVSAIVLTCNEERDLPQCLDALLDQTYPNVEVIVVDAASDDGTVPILKSYEARHPDRVKTLLSDERISIGEARNRGILASRGECVAFTSADAVPDRRWIEEAVDELERADVVYGLQLHTPRALNVPAVVRGLRYHHFFGGGPPEEYASNVNCVGRRALFLEFPFPEDGAESALDDILFAREAAKGGHRIAFTPRAIVSHVDVGSFQEEFRKVRREAYGWGLLKRRLGWRKGLLTWGAGLLPFLGLLAAWPGILTFVLLAAAVSAPTVRRVLRRGNAYPWGKVALALPVSVALDLALLIYYLKGVAAARLKTPEPDDGG